MCKWRESADALVQHLINLLKTSPLFLDYRQCKWYIMIAETKVKHNEVFNAASYGVEEALAHRLSHDASDIIMSVV